MSRLGLVADPPTVNLKGNWPLFSQVWKNKVDG